MTTKTARLFATDIEKAHVLAAVRGETPQQLLHLALNEFIVNHRSELDGAFRAVQRAVLTDDRRALSEILRADARKLADGDSARIARLLDEAQP